MFLVILDPQWDALRLTSTAVEENVQNTVQERSVMNVETSNKKKTNEKSLRNNYKWALS